MDHLDWNLIRSFVTVADTGSLSAAARKLGTSQPTVGRHIAELEQALDVTLFRRGRRGYVLTEAGLALLDRGRAVSEHASAFSRLALGAVEAIEGTVRILETKGHVARGYLGASLHPVRDANLKGAMVMKLDDEGPAKKAGLQIGDVIVGWNGDAVSGPRELIRRLGTDSVGADVKLWIMRGGDSREMPVTIGGKPL